jgi:hypothetical protein
MEQGDPSTSTPEDATEATPEQREIQDQLEHKDDDPDTPGRHESRHQIADEN